MSECTIHCWSSTSLTKPCPTCLDNSESVVSLEIENKALRERNAKLEKVFAVAKKLSLYDSSPEFKNEPLPWDDFNRAIKEAEGE